MDSKKKINKSIMALSLAILLVILGSTYAVLSYNLVGSKDIKISSRTLSVIIDGGNSENFTIDESIPIPDFMGLQLDGFNFKVKNNDKVNLSYDISLINNPENTVTDDSIIKYAIKEIENDDYKVGLLSETTDRVMTSGYLESNEEKEYDLKLWYDYSATNEQVSNKVFSVKIKLNVRQEVTLARYKMELNGNHPVLKDGLVPVVIDDEGHARRYEDAEGWYDYSNNLWANAVILKEFVNYDFNEVIPEDNIESYFVWIPRFDYQIFNMGNYTALGTKVDNTQIINVRFTNEVTTDNDTECVYPIENNQAVAGATGSCSIGKWMTHPAFTTMDIKGFWVGKFETGYDGATTTAEAQQDKVNTSKIIIKPNVYSWRNITVGNSFKNSYDYKREYDSHMMKNTEWGAMAYLSASKYGYKDEISEENPRTTSINNNNSNYVTGYASTEEPTKGYYKSSTTGNRQEAVNPGIDGTYTLNYLNANSQLASTTGNYSGVFDTSGGAWDYVMGYTTGDTTVGGSSGITNLYIDFFNDLGYLKYWDRYTSTTSKNFENRILGDATGELGPFQSTSDPDSSSRQKSSWYNDLAQFPLSSSPWFARGSFVSYGIETGIFSFVNGLGTISITDSFRIVLTP